jgi:hypothetical protein
MQNYISQRRNQRCQLFDVRLRSESASCLRATTGTAGAAAVHTGDAHRESGPECAVAGDGAVRSNTCWTGEGEWCPCHVWFAHGIAHDAPVVVGAQSDAARAQGMCSRQADAKCRGMPTNVARPPSCVVVMQGDPTTGASLFKSVPLR